MRQDGLIARLRIATGISHGCLLVVFLWIVLTLWNRLAATAPSSIGLGYQIVAATTAAYALVVLLVGVALVVWLRSSRAWPLVAADAVGALVAFATAIPLILLGGLPLAAAGISILCLILATLWGQRERNWG
jgi:hypothetical protein